MEIGIIGLSAAATLSRPGFRIKLRRIKEKSIPKRHRISKEDAMNFIRGTYQAKIGGE